MKSITLVLCSLALLSACGERGGTSQTSEKPAADAAQVNADIAAAHDAAGAAIDQAQQARGDAAAAQGGPERMNQYKRSVLKLIAGSYSGDCSTKSGARAGRS